MFQPSTNKEKSKEIRASFNERLKDSIHKRIERLSEASNEFIPPKDDYAIKRDARKPMNGNQHTNRFTRGYSTNDPKPNLEQSRLTESLQCKTQEKQLRNQESSKNFEKQQEDNESSNGKEASQPAAQVWFFPLHFNCPILEIAESLVKTK